MICLQWQKRSGSFCILAPCWCFASGRQEGVATMGRASERTVDRRTPRLEPEIARLTVLTALGELVDAGLGTWSERDDGLVELHLMTGERWLLTGEGVTRLT